MSWVIREGDCIEVMRGMDAESIDAVVCDPPYNLNFMTKPWDVHDGHEDAGFAYWLAGLIDGEGHRRSATPRKERCRPSGRTTSRAWSPSWRA